MIFLLLHNQETGISGGNALVLQVNARVHTHTFIYIYYERLRLYACECKWTGARCTNGGSPVSWVTDDLCRLPVITVTFTHLCFFSPLLTSGHFLLTSGHFFPKPFTYIHSPTSLTIHNTSYHPATTEEWTSADAQSTCITLSSRHILVCMFCMF